MSTILDTVIQYKPDHWDESNYRHKRYARIPLDKNSREFTKIKEEFIGTYGQRVANVVNIERIQHPFAYGNFIIRKMHIQKLTGATPTEVRKFVEVVNIELALEYNCDHRRGIAQSPFYMTGEYVLVMKSFSGYSFQQNDAHGYPEYLIQYKNANNPFSLHSLLNAI